MALRAFNLLNSFGCRLKLAVAALEFASLLQKGLEYGFYTETKAV